MTDVRIPEDVLRDGAEGVISAWLFRDGEMVERGAVLAELMDAKAIVELIAPAGGRLQILVDAEQPVHAGAVVARIDGQAG